MISILLTVKTISPLTITKELESAKKLLYIIVCVSPLQFELESRFYLLI